MQTNYIEITFNKIKNIIIQQKQFTWTASAAERVW